MSVDTVTSAPDLYSIPQEMIDFRETIRQIARERIAPRAGEIDREASYPWDIRKLLAEQDILGLPFAERYGGTGTGTLMLQIGVEEIARACATSALILMVQELGTLPIQLFGSEEQKQKWLPKCASGEWSPAFALSEPEAGSDPAAMRTSAVRDGEEWVINGQKAWITNATVADFYVVFATTDRENRRTSAFIVEKDRDGFDPGQLEHKLGIKGSPTGSPSFTDVRVPAENLIGEEGMGLRIALGTLERTRLGAAAQAVGIAQGRSTTPATTPRSGSPSASRSSSSRACSGSSPTWRPAPPPPASSSTRPARWPTATSPPCPSTPRWPSSSPPTTR